MTDHPVMPAGYESAIADATERFVQAVKELAPKQMYVAAMEIIRDVHARHPDLQASALWFNFGRALGNSRRQTEQ